MFKKQKSVVKLYQARRAVDVLSTRLSKPSYLDKQSWLRGICVVVERGRNHYVEVRVSRQAYKALKFFEPELEVEGVPIRIKAQVKVTAAGDKSGCGRESCHY